MKSKKLYFHFLLFTFYFLLSTCLYAGTNPAAFLNIGVGARALGMGGAFVSVADDATAGYWNPAGLSKLKTVSMGSMMQSLANSEWNLQEISPTYQFLSLVVPLNRIRILKKGGTFSVSWINTTLDNIPHTYLDTSNHIVRNTFEDRENAYYLSYGQSLISEELLVGGSLKYITQNFTQIKGASASGWDAEAGLIYSIGKKTDIGMVIQSGVYLKWANGRKDHGPLKAKTGISHTFTVNEYISVLVANDFQQAQKEPLQDLLGAEINYNLNTTVLSSIKLRGGINGIDIENRFGNIHQLNDHIDWTSGLGLDIHVLRYSIQLDYALCSYQLGLKHMFSVILNFD
ncbi:MAG: hypothetical protein AB1349_10925 [Elusimicrobiota bacterium]